MRRIEKLMFDEPPCDQECHVGTFFFTDLDGEEVQAEFYIRCCAPITTPEEIGSEEAILRKRRREIELNAQYADQFEALERSGCKNVRFVDVHPSPVF